MDKKIVELITESEEKGFSIRAFLSKVLSHTPEDGVIPFSSEEQEFIKRFHELSEY